MNSRRSVMALLLVAAGLFAATMAGRAWIRYSDVHSRAENLLARQKEVLSKGDSAESTVLSGIAQRAADEAREIAAIAPVLTLAAVLLLLGGGLLYRKATRRPRPSVLDEPRAPARWSRRGTPPGPRPQDRPPPS